VPREPKLDAPAPKPASSLSGLLSSLLVLSGVFFFINSACIRVPSGCNGSDDDECHPSTLAPRGASIEIVTPADGATVSGADAGLVPVRVVFAAKGVAVRSSSVCAEETGFFALAVNAIDVPDCGPRPSSHELRELTDGSSELTLMLAPGRYTLTARFSLPDGRRYEDLVDMAQVTVVGEPLSAGAAACP